MVEITKAKINLKEGIIELEGSEDFVMKILDRYEKNFISEPVKVIQPKKKHLAEEPQRIKREAVVKKPISMAPIPINLKGDENRPSLKELHKEKSPQTHQEAVTLFVYYISKYLDIPNVQVGQISSCYDEVGARKPKQIEKVFQEIQLFSGWLESGEEAHTIKITISGENMVEHFLPKPKKPQANITN